MNGDPGPGDVSDEVGVVEQAEPVVDALDPDDLDAGADVVGRAFLAEVHRRAEPELARPLKRLGEGGKIDAPLTRVAADPDQHVAVAPRGGIDEVGGGARAGRLVDVEDHAADDGVVGLGVPDPRRDARPDGVERDTVTEEERRGEEHLAIPHAGGGGDRECLVRDAVDVVGVLQAAADHVVDAEEGGEVVVAVEVGRVVDAEVDAVLAGELGDGVRRGGALDVHVELDLREGPDVFVGRQFGGAHHHSCPENSTAATWLTTAWKAWPRISSAVRGRGRSTGMQATIVDGRCDITTISSASSTASSIECVTSNVVVTRSIQIRCSSMFILRRVISSSAPNGSSSRSTRGSVTRARAIATRWRMPPDRWRGRAFSKSSSPTSLMRSSIADFSIGFPGRLDGEADVVVHVAPGEQRRVLEGDAEVMGLAGLRRRLAVHPYRPDVG